MLGTEIQQKLLDIPFLQNCYLGIFACDEAEIKLQTSELVPSFLVCNRDSSTEPGSHWLVIFRTGSSTYEIFDSLGQDEQTARSRLGSNVVSECVFNTDAVQSVESISCGKYVIYFSVARMLSYGETFQRVLNESFSQDLNFNEAIVEHYWTQDEMLDLELL
jgi:hypothetical protein